MRVGAVAALAVAGLALTATLGGIATTAHAAPTTTAKAKPAKGCPLTDYEKAGGGWWEPDANEELNEYPSTLYTTAAVPGRVHTIGGSFILRPIGKLTLPTKRGPRTVVNFCADRNGDILLIFPTDTVTGSATLTMSSRDGKLVTRKKFKVVTLNAVPAKPVSPTNISGEVRSGGFYFTWTPGSSRPEIEYYRFSCLMGSAFKPEIFIPWDAMVLGSDGKFGFHIYSINMVGSDDFLSWWQYDRERRTLTRVY